MRAILAAILTALIVSVPIVHAQEEAPDRSLYMVKWAAHVLTDDGAGSLDIGEGKGMVINLPMIAAKDGWLCIVGTRERKEQSQVQSIICHHGNGDDQTTVGATAICLTHHSDVDVQRMTIGSAKSKVSTGLVIECKSTQVQGA
jgi:hypothetical protein